MTSQRALVAERLAAVPWYVLVLPAALVWTTWLSSGVSSATVLRAMALGVACAAGAWVVLALLLRNARQAGLIVLAIELVLLSKAIVMTVEAVYRRAPTAGLLLVVLVSRAFILIVRIATRARGRIKPPAIHRAASVVALALAGILIVELLASGQLPTAVDELDVPPSPRDDSVETPRKAGRPDIFLILMDGYPRADVLSARMGFDNSAFLTDLRRRGFDIANESHSGYVWTGHSLPALFDMRYLEQQPAFRAIIEGDAPAHPTVRRLLGKSAGIATLRAHGYEFVAMSSGFEQIAIRDADRWVQTDHITDFEVKVLDATFLGDLINIVAPDFASSSHRHRVLEHLSMLPEIAAMDSDRPKFVFAHLPVPHQPAVFGSEGQPRAVPITGDFFDDSAIERHLSSERFVADYTAQLQHVNELVLASVIGILENSKVPPVVIVMSDHGTSSTVDWRGASWKNLDKAAVLERTGSLFAAHTPGAENVFPEDVEVVHVLPLLFNAYFGTDYELAAPPVGGIQIPPIDPAVLNPTGVQRGG